jgi:hypothetical protein
VRPQNGDVTYTGAHPSGAAGPSEVYRIDPDGGRTAIAWRLDLVNHSPTGLSWGYGGSGSAQCALAILADFLKNNDELAVRLHQDFKQRFVARFGDEWKLTGRSIRKWLVGSGTKAKAEADAYEEKLQLRTVSVVVKDDDGYKATLDPCGHEVWFATKPPVQTYCGECINQLVGAMRKRRAESAGDE